MTRTPVETLDARRYAECFAVFVSRSEEYPAMLDRLCGFAEQLRDGFACLDVGAGTGMVVREWMARPGPRPGRYVAVEPNPVHAAELRQNIASLGLDASVDEDAFDVDYRIPGTFDLTLFSHSLYWMTDPVACVRHACSALARKGRVVAFLQAPFGIHPMYRLFDPQLARDRPPGQDQGLSSAELVVGLRAAGLEPTVYLDPTPIDLTGLFDAGNETERDDFVSFCLQIEFSGVAEPLRSDVLSYLHAAGVEKNGRLLWHEPTATVVVRPS